MSPTVILERVYVSLRWLETVGIGASAVGFFKTANLFLQLRDMDAMTLTIAVRAFLHLFSEGGEIGIAAWRWTGPLWRLGAG